MALLDFLKKKPSFAKATADKKEIKKTKDTMPVGRQVKKTEKRPVKSSVVLSYDIIKEPHISEKATTLSDSNRYVFKVYPNKNKIEIAKEVEGVYGVDVLSVNIIKNPKKKRRLGKIQGFKSGCIKAIVKIKEGQKIEIL